MMGRPVPIDFGDLLIAVATDLADIRTCVVCGNDSTAAGLHVGTDGIVHVAAWCNTDACWTDRELTPACVTVTVPIDHLPALRRPPPPPPGQYAVRAADAAGPSYCSADLAHAIVAAGPDHGYTIGPDRSPITDVYVRYDADASWEPLRLIHPPEQTHPSGR